jgi:two-component system KDP operon response regulator KdpE
MNKDGLILIVDDEMPIRRLLIITLGANGYRTVEAATAKEALTMAAGHNPDLVILDLGLPDEDGIDVLKHLREWYSKPVLILSVRNSEEDIIQALDSGANDYLVKPFRMGELLARIRSAIRQGQTKEDNPVIDIADLAIDIANHTVRKKGELLKLTSTEFAMLALFAQNRGCVLTHQYILKEIWGHGYMEQSQYLRVFVAQLRKKIEDNPSKPALLITESGIGYRFGV